MKFTRRHLLAGAALLAVAGVGSGGLVVSSWWEQPPEAPFRYLSTDEVAFFDALADAIFPAGGEPAISGREAHVARYLDALLAGMVPLQRDLFRVALHGLDVLAFAQAGAVLADLPAERVAEVLTGWMVSSDGNLRGLAQSLHIFVGMAYLAHPEVAPVLAPQFQCGFGATPGGFGHAE